MRRASMSAWAMAATAAFAAGEPGKRIEGPDLAGWIVDAQTGKPPLVPAVVHVTWVLHADAERLKAGGEKTKRVVKEIDSVVGGRYFIVDWKQYVDTRGWKLVPGQDPIVRVYAPGYQRLVVENAVAAKGVKAQPLNAPEAKDWKWIGERKAQALTPLPETSSALAGELAAWKRDIDGDLAATPAAERDAAVQVRGKLLVLFDQLCNKLPAPPIGLCYAESSPVGRHVAQAKAERSQHLVVEEADGTAVKYRIEATSASSAQTAFSR